MLVPIMFALLVIWLLMLQWKKRHFNKLYEQIKTTRLSLPFIGHLYLFLCNSEEKMKTIQLIGKEAMRAKGVLGLWIAQKLYIMIADPIAAEMVLKNCLEKDDIMNCMHIGLGDGSIFAPVKIWRPRRKFMAPTFNMKNLKNFTKEFSKQSCILADKIKGAAGKDPISMWKLYSLYSMDAICGSLGVDVNAQEKADHPVLVAFEEFFNVITDRMFKPWLHSDFVFKLTLNYHILTKHKPIVYGFLDQIISAKRISKNNHGDRTRDVSKDCLKSFMDLMMESPANVSDVVIREESMVLVGAASDTSAVALGFTSLLLAIHPEVQEKVYQELRQVMTSDFDRPILAKDLPHFKYLDAVIREVLRLYPPVPIVVRKIDKNIELPSGVTLLPGCGTCINIWAINRNPEYWGKDADQFRPERFLDLAQHNPAFMTFGCGPRNCLGYQYLMMSMKTVLATLLRQYRLLPASDELAHEPLRVKYDVMMRHVDNYCVGIELRQ